MLAAVKLAKILPAYLTFLKKAVVRNQTDKKHLTTCDILGEQGFLALLTALNQSNLSVWRTGDIRTWAKA